jgi:hypothetical protein
MHCTNQNDVTERISYKFLQALLLLDTRTADTNHGHHHRQTQDLFTIRSYTIDVTYAITAILSGIALATLLGIMLSNVRRYSTMDRSHL